MRNMKLTLAVFAAVSLAPVLTGSLAAQQNRTRWQSIRWRCGRPGWPGLS